MTELQNAFACAARVFELIDEQPQIPDADDARILEYAEGKMEISHMDFSYTPERELIRDMNLSVRPGMRVAIVGPTGCGKTTLINLLMRFYDVGGGAITVDGTDIRGITRKSLRTNFGMVLQDTWLKTGTIRENIAMGQSRRDGRRDRRGLPCGACRFVHSHVCPTDTTPLSLRGRRAACRRGKNSCICIARVMLCLPPMLILDEATSSDRYPHRGAHPKGVRPIDERQNELYRRASPLDDPAGGRDPRHARRTYCRAGQS